MFDILLYRFVQLNETDAGGTYDALVDFMREILDTSGGSAARVDEAHWLRDRDGVPLHEARAAAAGLESPAEVGKLIALRILERGKNDGSFEENGYAAPKGHKLYYEPINTVLKKMQILNFLFIFF